MASTNIFTTEVKHTLALYLASKRDTSCYDVHVLSNSLVEGAMLYLERAHGIVHTTQQMRNRVAALRHYFAIIRQYRELSGVAWDPQACMFCATTEIVEFTRKRHSHLLVPFNTPLELCEELECIWG